MVLNSLAGAWLRSPHEKQSQTLPSPETQLQLRPDVHNPRGANEDAPTPRSQGPRESSTRRLFHVCPQHIERVDFCPQRTLVHALIPPRPILGRDKDSARREGTKKQLGKGSGVHGRIWSQHNDRTACQMRNQSNSARNSTWDQCVQTCSARSFTFHICVLTFNSTVRCAHVFSKTPTGSTHVVTLPKPKTLMSVKTSLGKLACIRCVVLRS